MTDIFSKLNPEHKLFNQLVDRNPVWWQNIVNNKDLYIEVRKDNYIDVYYNGGAILYLSYTNDFKGKIHFEYIPLVSETNYVPFKFLDNGLEIDTNDVRFANLDNLSANGLRAFQKRIGKFFPPSSEKGIQADFVLQNSAFLDSEFQYRNDQGDVRFDLVWVDEGTQKIYVIELKTISDPRLYFNERSRESEDYKKIDAQMKRYQDFITKQSRNLLSHYERVFAVKKKLAILPERLRELSSLAGFVFEERPVLLIGDCTQAWIDDNHERLNKALQGIAYGCFYQGKNTRRFYIPEKTLGNRYVWH